MTNIFITDSYIIQRGEKRTGKEPMKKSRIALFTLMSLMILLGSALSAPLASAQGEEWIESNRGRNFIEWFNPSTGTYRQEIYVGPMHTWGGSNWVPYIFTEKIFSYQVQHPYASIQFYDYYTKVFSENFENVVIYDDRWTVEYLNKQGKWTDSSFWGVVRSHEIISEDEIRLIRAGETSIGQRREIYTFRKGSPIKIRIEQTCDDNQTIRFVWKPSGIVAASEKMNKDDKNRKSHLTYYDNENNLVGALAWFDELEVVDNVDVVCESHAQGRKATITFGNFAATVGETVVLDPFIFTKSDPTEDAFIEKSGAVYTKISTNVVSFGHRGFMGVINWVRRGYVEWDISSIPLGVTITDVLFKYQGLANDPDVSAVIRAMAYQPSTRTDAQIYDDAGDGTQYLTPNATFVEVGTGKIVGTGGVAWSDLTTLKSDLTSALGGWFALGFHMADAEVYVDEGVDVDDFYSEEYASANPKPTLYVEYTFIGAPNAPTDLKVEGQTSPQKLTTLTPEFSFIYTDDNGDNMKAFRVQVGTSENYSDMWDNTTTENAENNTTVTITYAGSTLSWGTIYWWRVETQDNTDNWGPWSASENFGTASLPICSITAPLDGYDALVNEGIQFTSSAFGYYPLTYSWDFGDGGTSTEQNPTHTFGSSGDYTVTLIVNDGYEDSAPASITVNVTGGAAPPPGGGPGGPGGWVEQAAEEIEEIVQPSKNPLFTTKLPIFNIPIFFPLLVIGAITWVHKDRKGIHTMKGISYSIFMGVGFFLVMGAQLA